MLGWDLSFAICLIMGLSVLAYRAGRELGKQGQVRPLLFVLALAFCCTYSWLLSGGLFWAGAIPHSGVIYWSNFLPIALLFSAGLACETWGLDRWRRPLTVFALSLIAIGHLLLPVARPLFAPVAVADLAQWRDGVCMQSHESTCGAAAAATLLCLEGMPTSEQEMVRSCLTSSHGTEPLGLYRGLKLATDLYGRSPAIALRDPNQWDRQDQLPVVALVQYSQEDQSRPVRWLAGPGEGHAIVVLGYHDGRWVIGDPAVGRVHWSDEDFRRRFTGDAIYIVKQ